MSVKCEENWTWFTPLDEDKKMFCVIRKRRGGRLKRGLIVIQSSGWLPMWQHQTSVAFFWILRKFFSQPSGSKTSDWYRISLYPSEQQLIKRLILWKRCWYKEQISNFRSTPSGPLLTSKWPTFHQLLLSPQEASQRCVFEKKVPLI